MSAPKFRVVGLDSQFPDTTNLSQQDASAETSAAAASLRFIEPSRVNVSAGETLALLMHAARTNRAWISDFADETIEISQDMYEVLLAYKRVAYESNSKAA